MKKEPIVSFYIPAYKKPPEVFERCLDSLFDQSLKEIEVVVVFDGPDPDLEAVVKKYPKVISKVIDHAGVQRARNEGFKMTTGRYVAAWDADCYAKPEMASMWVQTFERNQDAAFVYSGYEFTNEQGGTDSEQFDKYSLECGNYIASMFPLKREFFPGWDESLKAGQDWDFWLSVVEKGGVGAFLMGRGFVTELDRDGISAKGWNAENREETIRAVRTKHGIPDRSMAVYGMVHSLKALHLAKVLGADQLKHSGFPIKNYKLLLNLGYSKMIRFEGAAPDAIKCQYWLPWDVDCLFAIAHRTAMETVRLCNLEVTHNFCNDIVSKKRLDELGIKAEILPLPTEIDDLESSFKEEFRVLVYADEAHKPIVKNIHLDLPYIPIDYVEQTADITKYSLLVDFHENSYASEEIKRFLLNGRHIISNVQAPFCGFMDLDVNHTEFRRELISRIRQAREFPFNKEAQDYYKDLVAPEKFRERIISLLPAPVLEVVK